MANQELSAAAIAAIRTGGSSDQQDTDRPVSLADGRPARASADAATKSALIAGLGVYGVVGNGRVSGDDYDVSGFGGALNLALNGKAVEADLRISAVVASETYYVSASSREVCMRSMEKQGLRINKKDITSVLGSRGARTRFNNVNTSHAKHYASGSWKTNGGGPRIQGPAGGPGSCKFLIIQR